MIKNAEFFDNEYNKYLKNEINVKKFIDYFYEDVEMPLPVQQYRTVIFKQIINKSLFHIYLKHLLKTTQLSEDLLVIYDCIKKSNKDDNTSVYIDNTHTIIKLEKNNLIDVENYMKHFIYYNRNLDNINEIINIYNLNKEKIYINYLDNMNVYSYNLILPYPIINDMREVFSSNKTYYDKTQLAYFFYGKEILSYIDYEDYIKLDENKKNDSNFLFKRPNKMDKENIDYYLTNNLNFFNNNYLLNNIVLYNKEMSLYIYDKINTEYRNDMITKNINELLLSNEKFKINLSEVEYGNFIHDIQIANNEKKEKRKKL